MTSPQTAGTTARSRAHAPIVNAQSAPGTRISSRATPQNAKTASMLIERTLSPERGQILPTSSTSDGVRGRIHHMDAIDRKILAELQRDGRVTITDLAQRVQLSVSPCHRRLRELERNGTIRGYRAVVDANALGLTFQALVFVTMRQEDRETLLELRGRRREDPERRPGAAALRRSGLPAACGHRGSRRVPAPGGRRAERAAGRAAAQLDARHEARGRRAAAAGVAWRVDGSR